MRHNWATVLFFVGLLWLVGGFFIPLLDALTRQFRKSPAVVARSPDITQCPPVVTSTLDPPRVVTSELRTALRTHGWALAAVYIGTPGIVPVHPALAARWTSQVGQDRTITKIFQNKKGGFFIDLAANDAVEFSNTLTLEQEFNWDGLCIEANPKYYYMLYQRKCMVIQAAVGKRDDDKIAFAMRDGFGGLVGTRFDNIWASEIENVTTVSLQRLLHDMNAPRVIDYLSLDIEGAEEFVFETFPWDRYQILLMTVERPKNNLKAMLLEHRYIHLRDHGDFGDSMWIHADFPGLDLVLAGN